MPARRQRLARRLCDKCKRPTDRTDEALAAVHFDPPAGMPVTICEPVGCSGCANTGYRGRLAIHEVMPMTEEIERLATARASSDEIRRTAVEQGMRTLRQDGWMNVARGSTTITEVLRVTA